MLPQSVGLLELELTFFCTSDTNIGIKVSEISF